MSSWAWFITLSAAFLSRATARNNELRLVALVRFFVFVWERCWVEEDEDVRLLGVEVALRAEVALRVEMDGVGGWGCGGGRVGGVCMYNPPLSPALPLCLLSNHLRLITLIRLGRLAIRC